MNFKTPTRRQRLEALGPLKGLDPVLQRALKPGRDFEPIPVPGPHDWLAVHEESGQAFEEFVRFAANRPDQVRRKIYLQPLGEFAPHQSPSLEGLAQYATAYFALKVEVLPSLSLKGHRLTTRINPYSGKLQVLSTDILILLKRKLPADAFCIMGITMEDLYPHPSWNFIFGQASLHERVGVYSFARYHPAFYGQQNQGNHHQLLMKRSCKVLAHEIAHMFGLAHCIYFKCLLNGSNHLQESDARPLHLCPVCLRKLQFCIGFDVGKRYRRLLVFYRENNFHAEARWVSRRLETIAAP